MAQSDNRLSHLRGFYEILGDLSRPCRISECETAPARGVYFVFEDGEKRSDTGIGLRIVRVGTVSESSSRSCLQRLNDHRNDNGRSIFRKLVGRSLTKRDPSFECPNWRVDEALPKDPEVRKKHDKIECEVSRVIGSMKILWLSARDDELDYIERNAIALLSNYGKLARDAASKKWLGNHCDHKLHPKVRKSGLWNQNHVGNPHDPAFLNNLRPLVKAK